MMNFDSFSHGQVTSKQWLCDTIEPYLQPNDNILILGGWHNVLGFMLATRNSNKNLKITNVDKDHEAILVANKLCDAWKPDLNSKDSTIITNLIANADTFDLSKYQVIINCSVEHMGNQWFSNVKKDQLVCIQSSDVCDKELPWLCTNPNPSMETLMKKYPMNLLYSNSKRIQYSEWGYTRFMLIGEI